MKGKTVPATTQRKIKTMNNWNKGKENLNQGWNGTITCIFGQVELTCAKSDF